MRWRNNDLDRPARSGEYLVLSKNMAFHTIKYDAVNGKWNANVNKEREIEVQAWTFLPSIDTIMSDLREE